MENFWQYDYITDDSNINLHIKLFVFIMILLLMLLVIPIKHYKCYTCYSSDNIIYLNITKNDFIYLENNVLYINNNPYNFEVLEYENNIVKLKLDNIEDGVLKVTFKREKLNTIDFLLGRN